MYRINITKYTVLTQQFTLHTCPWRVTGKCHKTSHVTRPLFLWAAFPEKKNFAWSNIPAYMVHNTKL
jgi:hypothetical protein